MHEPDFKFLGVVADDCATVHPLQHEEEEFARVIIDSHDDVQWMCHKVSLGMQKGT